MEILITKKTQEFVIPETVNFIELVKNSNTKLSLNCESKMIDLLNKEFTEQQSQWYITNLFMYLNYHPTNDYPINLENVYNMLGFANKGNAMKTIKSNFTKDDDYKIALVHTEKRKNEGGFNKEDIMLNIDTFKSLCMLVKTDKGKEIRKYYVKLENIHNKVIKEEIDQQKLLLDQKDKQLQEKENIIKKTQVELENTQIQLEKVSKLKIKKWYKKEKGHTVYAVKSNKNDPTSLITIGKSENISVRECSYMTLNQQAEMFYIKKCHNCNLVEKVIHHILDKHRIHNNKEWFQISDELAIYIIDMVCNIMDNFIDYSDELIKTSINDDLDKALTYLNINVIQDIEINEIKNIIIPEIKHQDNNENFTKFIQERCDIHKDNECTTFDITGAYRIWANGPSQKNRKNFTEFIKTNYKTKRKFDDDLDGQLTYYIGIKPNDFVILQENSLNLPKYEEFILNECIFGYNYRSNMNDVINEYKNWVIDKYNYYVFDKKEQNQLYCYIDRHFFRARLKTNNSKNDYQGVWGLRLKSDKSPLISIMKSNRKKILKIDIETKNILNEFSSLTAACNGFPSDYKSNCFRLSGEIKIGKIFDINNEKFILKYKNDIEGF